MRRFRLWRRRFMGLLCILYVLSPYIPYFMISSLIIPVISLPSSHHSSSPPKAKTKIDITLTPPPQCVDITFALPEDVAEVNSSNCFNTSDISFANVYTINDASAPGTSSKSASTSASTAASPSRSLWAACLASVLGVAMWGFL